MPGPHLLSIYIIYLDTAAKKINPIVYADDTAVIDTLDTFTNSNNVVSTFNTINAE